MAKFGKGTAQHSATIMIEVVLNASEHVQVTVTYAGNPTLIYHLKELTRELAHHLPRVELSMIVKPANTLVTAALNSRKRGGPIGTPQDKKIKIVRGWQQLQGRMNQEIYAGSQGIAPSTLRRWTHELQEDGKL